MRAFDCKLCGACCYGKGGIFVTRTEIERIADFLGITPSSFRDRYCKKIGARFSVKSGQNGFCLLFDREKHCLIHPVKPGICSLWPFYPAMLRDGKNWKTAQNACPGINPDCSHESFVKQSKTIY